MNPNDIKQKLTEEEWKVTQEKGTEVPFVNKYWNTHEDGTYHCKVCDTPLFASDTKFDSGTGWPSFGEALPGAVKYINDDTHGMVRTEVVCANCGAHLGHVFDDGKETGSKTEKRFCMNSCSLDLK